MSSTNVKNASLQGGPYVVGDDEFAVDVGGLGAVRHHRLEPEHLALVVHKAAQVMRGALCKPAKGIQNPGFDRTKGRLNYPIESGGIS